MKLEIRSFADAGQQQKERLVIRALSDVDVGDYLVLCSTVTSDGKAVAGTRTAYWFPDKQVKSGDLVVLYSKRGTRGEKQLESGATAHFFYWGREDTLWPGGNGAVLMRASEWKLTVPERSK